MRSDDTTIWNLWLRYGRYLNVSFRISQKGADSGWENRCIRILEIVITEEHQIHFITYNILACNWAFVNDFYTSLLFECKCKSLPPIAALWESIVPCTSRGKLLHTTTPLTFLRHSSLQTNFRTHRQVEEKHNTFPQYDSGSSTNRISFHFTKKSSILSWQASSPHSIFEKSRQDSADALKQHYNFLTA